MRDLWSYEMVNLPISSQQHVGSRSFLSRWKHTRHLGMVTVLLTVWLFWGGQESLAAGGYNFKKWGLGFSLGIQNTFNQTGDPAALPAGSRYNLGYGVGFSYLSIGIEGSWEFEQNWALNLETHFSFHACATPTRDAQAIPGTVCSKDHLTPIMFAAFTSINYLFLQDDFRPYLGAGIGVWQSLALVNASVSAFGPTVTLGFHWYFAESLALGVRVRYGTQIVVEATQLSVFHQIMAVATFNAYL